MLVKDSIADQQIYVFCLIETWLQQGVEYVRLNESAPWVRVIVTIQVEAIWHLSILISPRCKLGNNFFENVTQTLSNPKWKNLLFLLMGSLLTIFIWKKHLVTHRHVFKNTKALFFYIYIQNSGNLTVKNFRNTRCV